jgi:ppGpp synthetase/RelA/SpoT-type nucleotidyltranferase
MSAKGGITKGKSHKEGGIPMVVKSTNQRVELEGGEGVINKKNMADTQLHDFEGKKLTKCEIASEINSDGGNGVEIDCGNIIGKKYKYGMGGTISESELQKGWEWDVTNQEHKTLPNRSIRYNSDNGRYELYDYINKTTDYSYTTLDDLVRNVNNIMGETFRTSKNIGGYLAIASQIKEIAPHSVDAIDQKASEQISNSPTSFDKGGKIKVGKRYGDWSVTQYEPITYDDLGSANGGTLKLVNQETFDVIIINNNKALRGSKWFTNSIKGLGITDKSLNVVIDKSINAFKPTYAKGGEVDFFKSITEDTLNPYNLFQQYNNEDYVDDNVTLLNGTIDLKFKRQPKNETKPSNNLPYEVKSIINADFEYVSYGEMGNKKSMSLREGSWGDFYIEFENLTLNELKEIVLPLSENVAEALDDKGIKGYGELGLNSYGNAIDIEVSEDNEKDTDTYAKGGVVKVYEAITNDNFDFDKGSREWHKMYLDITPLVWARNMQDGYKIDVYSERYGEHLGTIDIDYAREPNTIISYDKDKQHFFMEKGGNIEGDKWVSVKFNQNYDDNSKEYPLIMSYLGLDSAKAGGSIDVINMDGVGIRFMMDEANETDIYKMFYGIEDSEIAKYLSEVNLEDENGQIIEGYTINSYAKGGEIKGYSGGYDVTIFYTNGTQTILWGGLPYPEALRIAKKQKIENDVEEVAIIVTDQSSMPHGEQTIRWISGSTYADGGEIKRGIFKGYEQTKRGVLIPLQKAPIGFGVQETPKASVLIGLEFNKYDITLTNVDFDIVLIKGMVCALITQKGKRRLKVNIEKGNYTLDDVIFQLKKVTANYFNTYAKGGSIKRNSNSPLLKYVNFEDGWSINMKKLNLYKNLNGKAYKDKNKYGISRQGGKKQDIWQFETLNEAEIKFDELVELGKTYSKIRNQGDVKENYADGGATDTITLISDFGYDKSELPQIRSSVKDEFRKYLTSKYGQSIIDIEFLDAKFLKPIQKEVNKNQLNIIQNFYDKNGKFKSDRPITISKDGYIIDGHHRWYVAKANNLKIKATKVNLLANQVIEEMFASGFAEQDDITAIRYSDGGRVSKMYMNAKVPYKEYPSLFGDNDGDSIPNVDDVAPMNPNINEQVEEVRLSDEMRTIIDYRNEFEGVRKDMVHTLSKIINECGGKGECGIMSRTKTPYSIINKLRRRSLTDVKDIDSLERKAKQKIKDKDLSGIDLYKGLTDVVGTMVVTPDKSNSDKIKNAILKGKVGRVLEFEDMYKEPKAGYRAYHFLVAIEKDGKEFPIEIQVKTERIKKLSSLAHTLYKQGKINPNAFSELMDLANKGDKGSKKAQLEFDTLMQNENKVKKMITTQKLNLGGTFGMYDIEDQTPNEVSEREVIDKAIPHSQRLSRDEEDEINRDVLLDGIRQMPNLYSSREANDEKMNKAFLHYYNEGSHFFVTEARLENGSTNDEIYGFKIIANQEDKANFEHQYMDFIHQDYGDDIVNWKLDFNFHPQLLNEALKRFGLRNLMSQDVPLTSAFGQELDIDRVVSTPYANVGKRNVAIRNLLGFLGNNKEDYIIEAQNFISTYSCGLFRDEVSTRLYKILVGMMYLNSQNEKVELNDVMCINSCKGTIINFIPTDINVTCIDEDDVAISIANILYQRDNAITMSRNDLELNPPSQRVGGMIVLTESLEQTFNDFAFLLPNGIAVVMCYVEDFERTFATDKSQEIFNNGFHLTEKYRISANTILLQIKKK